MPVFASGYRSFEGKPNNRLRWLIVVEQEFKILAKLRTFKLLYLLAYIHVIVRMLQIVAFDVIAQDPNSPLQMLFANLEVAEIKAVTFFSFLYLQTPLVFILLLYAGSGMICNDLRNNLMEVYFSKPLTWRDYALGKIMALYLLGLSITALPGILLVLLHNLLLPGMHTLTLSWWWPLAILAYSSVMILPTALSILAASSLMPSQNYAAITIFMALIANTSLAGLLAGMLRVRNLLALSMPMSIRRVGESLFGEHRILFSLHWQWCLYYAVALCFVAALIILIKIRRQEIMA
ncbi:MAG: hypothetical protein GX130_09910 [Candidatus Hydrogenedens sp.]|jgi:hypothetical protein|nr:hypothetical protein [Candidatus Hydrogenedens sp.]